MFPDLLLPVKLLRSGHAAGDYVGSDIRGNCLDKSC